jgi:hypothetical protein
MLHEETFQAAGDVMKLLKTSSDGSIHHTGYYLI